MADVTTHSQCASLEPSNRTCRLNGQPCPMTAGNYRDCGDSTFVSQVSMPPDEFQVLLNSQGQPALGSLSFRRCRRWELHQGVAGVHVNVILETVGDEAMLQAEWKMDGTVEYFCPASGVRMLWRDGKFIPL